MKRIISFFKGDSGSMSVEAVLVFPLLLWAFGGTFLFWDLYQTRVISQRAAYTVADTLSREVDAVDADYIAGLKDVHTYLIQGRYDSRMRVTTVAWDDTAKAFEMIWSHTPDDTWIAHTDATLNDEADRIPDMTQGDVAILVEVQVRWVPFLWVGVGPTQMETFIITRPRFGPQLVWENADGTQIGYGST